jgi:hypothetical protein
VDRDDYVAANLRLLARLPVFPGAKAEGVLSEPWQVRQDPYGRPYTTGYSTRATFSVPARTKAGDVDRYFRKALHSWHMGGVGTVQEGWPHPLGPEARSYIVSRGYDRGYQSVSVNLLAFLKHGRLAPGGHFTISVDYRGLEPRTLQFVCCALPNW